VVGSELPISFCLDTWRLLNSIGPLFLMLMYHIIFSFTCRFFIDHRSEKRIRGSKYPQLHVSLQARVRSDNIPVSDIV